MGLASEMKNLSEEILNSFKQRMKENEELTKGSPDFLKGVQKTLDGFRKDHQEMTNVLRANAAAMRSSLASSEKERVNTYIGLMDGIHVTISNIQNEVVAIQSSTFNMLNEFAGERAHMAEELNKLFATGRAIRMQDEEERIKEFDNLMETINKDLKSINDKVLNIFKDTNDMLARFESEHQEMSVELRAELGKNLTARANYTKSLLLGFQKRLIEIGNENQQIAKAMRNDLANNQIKIKKGEAARLIDFNVVFKGISEAINGIGIEVIEIQKATTGMIDGYSKDRSEAAAEWSKMQETIAQIKKTGLVKPAIKKEKKAEKTTEFSTEETKEIRATDIAVEKSIETPAEVTTFEEVKENPVNITEQKDTLTVEERIIDYINKHPKGVKISEMEKPLGETRMKLGYLAKNLLDAGKVQKVENVYFPIK